jgi:hypothetical protein
MDDLEILERETRNLERALASRRELGGTFGGDRNFTLETTARANLPRVELGDIECRVDVCRISPARGQDDAFWKQALDWQTQGWLRRKRDALSLERGALYFTVRDDDETFGIEVLDQFIDVVLESGALERCTGGNGVDGELLLRARILPEYHADNRSGAAELAIDFHGALVDSAVGRCLAQQVMAVADEFQVPERVSEAIAEAVPLWPPDRRRPHRERHPPGGGDRILGF